MPMYNGLNALNESRKRLRRFKNLKSNFSVYTFFELTYYIYRYFILLTTWDSTFGAVFTTPHVFTTTTPCRISWRLISKRPIRHCGLVICSDDVRYKRFPLKSYTYKYIRIIYVHKACGPFRVMVGCTLCEMRYISLAHGRRCRHILQILICKSRARRISFNIPSTCCGRWRVFTRAYRAVN